MTGPLASLAGAAGLTEPQTEAALGTLVGAMQLSLPSAVFAQIEQAIPNARSLAGKSLSPMGGRTGEIAAVTAQLRTAEGAARLADQLQKSGLSSDQVRQVAQWIVARLRSSLGAGPADSILASLPGLQRLA